MGNKRMKYVCLDCLEKIKNKDDYEWHKDVGHKVRLVDPDKFEKDLPEINHIIDNDIQKAIAIFKRNPKKYMKEIGEEVLKSFNGVELKEPPKDES